ncbi:hypothetical protein CK203_089467 [Vitis vinifera]|uniref:Retrotransposon gag domain-containing protein n=1 Tax=Vitis vinifera TaxID=29760 RepID=A0A438E8Z6_VITVI|nr:hypothetical protein CK203_089467 [Vitis vinifera]
MDPPPEDQNSHKVKGVIPTHIYPMRDRMHPPRMSAPSCILPPLEQLIIRPHIVPLLPNSMEWRVRIHMPTSRSLRRYMEAINACPHHGFDTWLLNPEEAMDFLSYVAEVSRGWDEPNSREKGSFPLNKPQNPKAGMYMLSEDVDMKAKVATLARRLEELELKKMHEVQAISIPKFHVMPCTICQSCDHVVDDCPTMPAVREMLGDQVNVVGNLGPTTVHPMVTPIIQAGETIQIFVENKTTSIPTASQTQAPQQTSSVEQAIANLSKVMNDFVVNKGQSTPNCTQKIENVESSLNKRMDGMQNDLIIR